jgi:hypothetical protein
MALLRWIRSRRDGKIVSTHVEALLSWSATRVREATLPRAATLAPAEARGYVRAKATTILVAAIERQGRSALPGRLHAIVLRTAVDRATAAVLEHVRERRAAERPQRRAA